MLRNVRESLWVTSLLIVLAVGASACGGGSATSTATTNKPVATIATPPTTTTTTAPPVTTTTLSATTQITNLVDAPVDQVRFDPQDSTWAVYIISAINDFGYGFAHQTNGTWVDVTGIGSTNVGCLPPRAVPQDVIAALGFSCHKE